MNIDDLPLHKGSLSLTHNDHKSCYQSIEQFEQEDYPGRRAWISDEQRLKAIEQDSVWVLHWYPDTPVGFHILMACDLDVLIAKAKE